MGAHLKAVHAGALLASCQRSKLPGTEEQDGGVSSCASRVSDPGEQRSATGALAAGSLSASSATTALRTLSCSACTVLVRASRSGCSVLGTVQAAPKLYLNQHS